ncbi:hypothetical protein Pedsa_0937 [Pseudopedobacter saltans DSM 12145]|uniref:Uncharacterized protein n=1 Tax=Pseudopedobacter saltans (strain ATCC 51119 / DSM 12145 / JCM 21818 / CCUG 39354 / LMG 10337 / NBRC 100064 / NCIMB 13643) TaxID=762903 RepID=F0SAD2_PSESL|nr:hypothetical protein [Pseudopedobacter saltans]ADY51509.1 hypothetical protein Pedsa_0937 [Pseudopedobacter saltans DSM 12145]
MERIIKNTFTKEISTAVFNDWSLNFTVERDATKVLSVQVTGQTAQSYFNAHRNEAGNVSVSFSGQGGYDNVLANAVTEEINLIVAQPVVEA